MLLVKDLLIERKVKLNFSDSFEEILRKFKQAEDSALPVYDGNGLLGVVRQIDAIRAVSQRSTPSVSQLLRDEQYKYVNAEDLVEDIKRIEDYLLVLNNEGHKFAILLPKDLAEALPSVTRNEKELGREIDAIINFSSDEIYVSDGQGVTLRANAVFEDNCGVKVSDILGKSVYELEKEKVFSPSATRLVLEKKNQQSVLQTQKSGNKTLVTATPVFNKDGSIFRVITNCRNIDKLNDLNSRLQKAEKEKQRYYQELIELRHNILQNEEVVVSSNAMQKIVNTVKKIARVDSTVLLQGESGVGKGLIATLIHKMSHRKDGPLISINCSAIPEKLLESELFGYEGGAFTGARKEGKLGKIELASGGTFFLDEIGELPLELQAKILHVIQEKQLTRIGRTKSVQLDVRFIAATNRNLEEEVKKGRFRRDLFFRLNVLPINIPSLKERQDDIESLVELFLKKFNKKYNTYKEISPDVLLHFKAYSWPGNIRELENLLERLTIVADRDTIEAEDLPVSIKRSYNLSKVERVISDKLSLPEAVEEYERSLLQKAFNDSKSTYDMADKLGVNQSTIVRKLKKYHITKTDFSEEKDNAD